MSYQPVGGGSGYSTPGGNAGYGNSSYRDDPEHHDYDNAYRSNDYPMSSGNPYAASASNPAALKPKKSKKKLWWILAAILLIGVIVGAVVGGVVGSRNAKDHNDANSANDKSNTGTAGNTNTNTNGNTNTGSNTNNPAGASAANNTANATDSSGRPTTLPSLLAYTSQTTEYTTGSNGQVYLPLAVDTNGNPAYGIGAASSGYAAPSINSQPANNGAWPSDPDSPSNSTPRAHPRLIAPKYKWDALKNGMIAADPYLSLWNETIVNKAAATLGDPGVKYVMDGGPTLSGVLDVAREVKMKVKNWAYAYSITGQDQYAQRVWAELQHASNTNGDFSEGSLNGDIWNCDSHFLDCAEFTSAFAIAYDWLYDFWSADQRTQIRGWITTHGISYGVKAYASPGAGWWSGVAPGTGGTTMVNGNWNCVSNAGMILGCLAIAGEDSTCDQSGLMDKLIGSSKNNCFQGAYSDGSWAETPDYWYFGTTGAAEMVSALQTAVNEDLDLNTVNPGWKLTSLYHMYVQGMTWLFAYGDHGPNKYSTTANSLMLWGSMFNEPRYTLFQRDQANISEPFSMFWYDPTAVGTWWSGLAIDNHFQAAESEWATARSSWSDNSGTYWAMKAGQLVNHQNHNNLDIGDFVFDAMGQRWAGELGSDQYIAPSYFDGAEQNSTRWTYYRTRTEGQNTILIGRDNQLLTAAPTVQFQSSGTVQGNASLLSVDKDDTAYMTIDMSSAYGNGITAKRGIRFLNGRTQMLLQDEVSGAGSSDIMWRMHTNATADIDSSTGTTAILSLPNVNVTLKVELLNAQPSGLKFSQMPAGPFDGEVAAPQAMPNNGTNVLVIDSPTGGSLHTEVLFTPQWPDKSDYVTPPSVALDSWTLTSHN